MIVVVFVLDNYNDWVVTEIEQKDERSFLKNHTYIGFHILPLYKKRKTKKENDYIEKKDKLEIKEKIHTVDKQEKSYEVLKYEKDYSAQFILVFTTLLVDNIIEFWINTKQTSSGYVKVIKER